MTTEPKGCLLDIDSDGVATLTLDLPGKVNVMNDDFMAGMEAALQRLEASGDHLRGVYVCSAKPTFLAGGDLGLMGRAKPGQEQVLFDHFERLKGFLRRLERLGVPVVAGINGSALGGGCELALACHRRIALRSDKTWIGLPEIGFAILAGAGGVVRLTGILGLDAALDLLLSGKTLGVDAALAHGLVDDVAGDEQELRVMALDWIRANPVASQPWDAPRTLGCHALAPHLRARLTTATFAMDRHPAADRLAALRITQIAVEATFQQVDAVLRAETRALVELMVRPEAATAIAAFFEARRRTT